MGEFRFTSGGTEPEKAEPLSEQCDQDNNVTLTDNGETADDTPTEDNSNPADIRGSADETPAPTHTASPVKYRKPAPQKSAAGSVTFLRFMAEFPIAMSVTIAFLLWGFLWDGFYVSWTLFLLIPIFHSAIEAISKKDIGRFAYPVLVVFVYCLLGLLLSAWHPYWILFLTIPIFYTVVNQLKKR